MYEPCYRSLESNEERWCFDFLFCIGGLAVDIVESKSSSFVLLMVELLNDIKTTPHDGEIELFLQ